MPRPDLKRLGINHRRIPVVSIGRDVYVDTRLILEKLEALFPEKPRLGASDGNGRAMEGLLDSFHIVGGTFTSAMRLLPSDLPLLKSDAFKKDRADYTGARPAGSPEESRRARAEALADVRRRFTFVESNLLADGRQWVLGTQGPSLADIQAIWPLHWISGIPGALPADVISADAFPKTYSWIARFQQAVSAAKRSSERPEAISGEQAKEIIESSEYNEPTGVVDDACPIVKNEGLKAGDDVLIFPTDSGRSGKDSGTLVSLDARQTVIEVEGRTKTRLHAPREGFRVVRQDKTAAPNI